MPAHTLGVGDFNPVIFEDRPPFQQGQPGSLLFPCACAQSLPAFRLPSGQCQPHASEQKLSPSPQLLRMSLPMYLHSLSSSSHQNTWRPLIWCPWAGPAACCWEVDNMWHQTRGLGLVVRRRSCCLPHQTGILLLSAECHPLLKASLLVIPLLGLMGGPSKISQKGNDIEW
jgi:hypothetical protein